MQDSVIERCARALWDARDLRFPKFTRQPWKEGTQLARETAMSDVRAVLSVPGIFIAPDRKPEDSDLGYRGRIYMAFCDWLEPTLYDLSQSLSGTAINEGDA